MTDVRRQTRTHLMSLFKRMGLFPRGDLGQNFLIDINLIDFIVKNAELDPQRDVSLEVGSGTGGLTAYIACSSAAAVTVEFDSHMHGIVSQTCAHYDNLKILHADALHNKNHLNPVVIEAFETALAAGPDRCLKLVANLPYNVGTPVMSNLLAGPWPLERMVVTIQYELAQRLCAGPGSSTYSALSVWFQSQCKLKLLRKLPPTVFWPRPKVDSAILLVVPDPEKRARIVDRKSFQEFLRLIFTQRRKALRGVLHGLYQTRFNKAQIDEMLTAVGVALDCRAEQLSVDSLIELGNRLGPIAVPAGLEAGSIDPESGPIDPEPGPIDQTDNAITTE